MDPNPDVAAVPAQPETPPDAPSIDTLSEADRKQWELTGELPAPAADPDAEPEDAPGPPPAPVRPVSKRQQEINDHLRAKAEAIQRADAAEKRLAELEANAQRSDPTPPAQLPAPEDDKEPVLDDFLDTPDPYLAYSRAIAKYDALQVVTAQESARDARTKAQREQDDAQQLFLAYQAREAALKLQHPDFDTKTAAVRNAIDLRTPLGSALVESPVAPQLILHLAEHPEDFERIGRLGVTNLPAALRELGRLEAKFEPDAAPSGPAPKTVTSAPSPPSTLGRRPADVADDADAAVAREDFRAYADAENRKEIVRMGRR